MTSHRPSTRSDKQTNTSCHIFRKAFVDDMFIMPYVKRNNIIHSENHCYYLFITHKRNTPPGNANMSITECPFHFAAQLIYIIYENIIWDFVNMILCYAMYDILMV